MNGKIKIDRALTLDERLDALSEILFQAFGDSVEWDDGIKATAKRVFRFWVEYRPDEVLDFDFTTFPAVANHMIIVPHIEFSSICAHHLLPFYGEAYVGYLPNTRMVGLSKIPRLVDYWAKRPQTQERLADQIATDLKDRLEAQGVAVVIEARHTCMSCRGVRKHNASMITSEMRGSFLTSGAAREEFMDLIKRDRL
jgi:GTP cyclohydrolase IA